MKKYWGLVIGVLICTGVIATGYAWAMNMIGSLYDYRSPIKDSAPASLPSLGKPVTERLVFILVDGLRKDTALNAALMPNLARLRSEGASATIHSEPPSYSEPAYTTLLTGASPDISDGPAINLDYESIPTFTQDNLFSSAHRAGLKTAISGYYWFEKLVPQAAVDSSFYTPGEDNAADQAVIDSALPWIKDGNEQLILIHLDQVDYAGHHEGGPQDPRWNEAAARADAMIGQIAGSIDLSRDTVLVLSDHGHIRIGGHGGQDKDVLVQPLVLAGKGIKPGEYGDIDQMDIAPTLAALLGAAVPSSSEGQVRAEILNLPTETLAQIPGYLNTQLAGVVSAYSRAVLGSELNPLTGDLAPQQAREMIKTIRLQKLEPERSHRSVLALILVVVPLFVIILKWRKEFAWYFVGALLTLFLFNLRYAWIDGRTYSLSSVRSEMDMILYVGVTAAISFTFAWLGVMLITRSFKKGGLGAALGSILFTLFSLYIFLVIALVNFGVNGWKVTWTLPDFLIQYMGLIAVIIAIFIAMSGLVLTGVGAFTGWLIKRKA
jgi:hypothetical protein